MSEGYEVDQVRERDNRAQAAVDPWLPVLILMGVLVVSIVLIQVLI